MAMPSLEKPLVAAQQAFKILAVLTFAAGAAGLISAGRNGPPPRVLAARSELDSKGAPSLTYYSGAIARANIFRIAAPVAAKPKPAPPPPPKPTLAELASDLSLVGVLNNGEQAAILSRKSKETLYLSVGQQIAGITIAAIEGDHVKLAYDGQTMDLSL